MLEKKQVEESSYHKRKRLRLMEGREYQEVVIPKCDMLDYGKDQDILDGDDDDSEIVEGTPRHDGHGYEDEDGTQHSQPLLNGANSDEGF